MFILLIHTVYSYDTKLASFTGFIKMCLNKNIFYLTKPIIHPNYKLIIAVLLLSCHRSPTLCIFFSFIPFEKLGKGEKEMHHNFRTVFTIIFFYHW